MMLNEEMLMPSDLSIYVLQRRGCTKRLCNSSRIVQESRRTGGNAKSQLDLGWMYLDGVGVNKDEKEAAKWFKKAADQGFEPAIKALEFIPDTVKN